MPERGPRKYDPLTRHLAELTEDEVTLTFAEIGQIVGTPLPPSARPSSFWSTTMQSLVARPWTRAGWRVLHTDLRGDPPAVTFARVRSDSTAEHRRDPASRPGGKDRTINLWSTG